MGFIGIALLAFLFLIFLVLSLIAFIGLIIGIVLNIIFTKKKKEGKTYGKVLAIISRVQIIICSVLLVPFVALLIFAAVRRTIVPKEFVKTEDVIQWYNDDEMMTSNGLYVSIDLEPTKYFAYYEYDDVVYSYMPNSPFDKYKWSNHPTIKNDTGYEIVCLNAQGTVKAHPMYCKKENLDDILTYYNDNNSWYFEDNKVNDEDQTIIADYNNHISYYNNVTDTDSRLYCFSDRTNDDVFVLKAFSIAYYQNEIYFVEDYNYDNKYKLYSIDEDLSNAINKYLNVEKLTE